MKHRPKGLTRARALALLAVVLSLLVFAFATSPWGRDHGDAVDYYFGIVYLSLLAVIAVLALQSWWVGQQERTQRVGNKPTSRLTRMLTWWYHLGTDWEWKDDDKRQR